jgi:hypothetical protein
VRGQCIVSMLIAYMTFQLLGIILSAHPKSGYNSSLVYCFQIQSTPPQPGKHFCNEHNLSKAALQHEKYTKSKPHSIHIVFFPRAYKQACHLHKSLKVLVLLDFSSDTTGQLRGGKCIAMQILLAVFKLCGLMGYVSLMGHVCLQECQQR